MLFLYFVFFLFWFLLNYRKHGFNPSSFLIGVYTFCSAIALFLLYYFQLFQEERINTIAILYHIICLYLFLSPIIYFGNISIENIPFPPFRLLRYLIWLIITLSFISIIISLGKLKTVFAYQELREARVLHNAGMLHEKDSNIFSYFGALGHHLSIFALFFFFYIFTNFPKKKYLQILLFLSSFAIVISNFAIAGRDGVIRWLFFFLFFFSFFRMKISRKRKKKIITLAMLGGIPIIAVFFAISESRWNGRADNLLTPIAAYTGQSFLYFSYNFPAFIDGSTGGRSSFPILFPNHEKATMNNLNDYIYADYNLNTFTTFVGSFYLDMGLLTTLLIALIFYLTANFYFRFYKPKVSFVKLIVFIIFYQVMLLGVFYFMFYSETVVKTLIALAIISSFLQYRARSKMYPYDYI